MKKVANEKKQMVKIYFGFYGDKKYGADYEALKNLFLLRDIMPYYSFDTNNYKDVKDISFRYIIGKYCPDVPKDNCGYPTLSISANTRFLEGDNTFLFTIKIGD